MSWVKNFKGHSGCKIELHNEDGLFLIKKTGGGEKLKQSANILNELSKIGFKTPKIYSISENEIKMEYINGINMSHYIYNADADHLDKLIFFLNSYIERQSSFELIDITEKIYKKLQDIQLASDLSFLNFTIEELFEKLPKTTKCGLVHGDLTLENILYYKNDFYLIDANPTDILSIEYDASKILQDLDCLWFVRFEDDKMGFDIPCRKIGERLKNKWNFLNNKYILVFMLLRIFPYCTDEQTKKFLITEINKKWQS